MSFTARQNVKNPLDQFYTTTSTISGVIDLLLPLLSQVNYIIDPAAGSNEFVSTIMKRFRKIKAVSYDISPPPKTLGTVIKQDFLKLSNKIKANGVSLFGFNPPFGYQGKIAKDIILHGINLMDPEIIAMILPLCINMKQYRHYNQILCHPLPENSFYNTSGMLYNVNTYLCVYVKSSFQIPKGLQVLSAPTPSICADINRIFQMASIAQLKEGKPYLVIRRIGRNKGRNGFIIHNNNYEQFFHGKITGKIREIPTLTPKAFMAVEMRCSSKKRLKAYILHTDRYSVKNLKGKRSINKQDLHAGMATYR